MDRERTNAFLSFGIPQVFTAARILLAGWALSAAARGEAHLAATLIIYGTVTDALDGKLARRLGSTSEFGGLFDYFADYFCYIVAPWFLSTSLLPQGLNPVLTLSLGLPLLAGAVRYARNGLLLRTENFEQVGFPGLGTVFYTNLITAWVFLGSNTNRLGALVLGLVVPMFSVLMVSPVRYPKLVTSKLVCLPVLLGLIVMPFFLTRYLATLALILVSAYVLVGPFVMRVQGGARLFKSLKESVISRIAARRVVKSLTGDPGDLKKLLNVYRIVVPGPAFRLFLDRLSDDIDNRRGLGNFLLHLGKTASRHHKRKLAENLIVNWAAKGARIRTRLSTPERWLPFFVVVSPTMRCNLKCAGCYSALYLKDGELSEADLDSIFRQSKELGAYFSVISGGEPYLLKDTLLRLFRRHSDMFFLTFTNATLLDDRLVNELGRLGNVAPAISVEGYEGHTDQRRSAGVYEKAMAAMVRLRRQGLIFGISVTYTRDNVELVSDERFLRFYIEKGAAFAWYFMFMPVGKEPRPELVPTPEQRLACGRRLAELRKRLPIFIADFWNDGRAAGGCLAGGRRYLHILNSGRVEPCVFAHFGTDNIREKSLLDAANSPFFQAIRREFPYNESGNLHRPCMIVDNPQVLRRLVNDYLVPQGHAHSEDIVRDPEVVKWVDTYSERMKELTETEWLLTINDPASRWYKEKPEYRNLFRFKKGAT
ncbi:MAG: radical SAM protein [Acidobacteria bacterium]|nr:MAG: radical SAM protein [Acidobacteriota bacterium]